MIFTYKCVKCERLFTAESKSRHGLAQTCVRCLPLVKEDIDLEI